MTNAQVQPDPAAGDAAARAIAAWLSPYIAAELDKGSPREASAPETPEAYDSRTCREFVSTLGNKVLHNSRVFFLAIVEQGQVGSLELASLIGVGSPRNIPAVLTTPLKRRARAMGLGNPWQEGADHTNRTVWLTMDGVARRMLSAIDTEITSRQRGEGQ